MKSLPFLLTLLTAATSFGQAPPPTAVAYTLPSGYVKFNLVVGFNPIGINLHGVILTPGTIDSEDDIEKTITDADVDFTTILTDAQATYTIEITSGPQNGAVAEIKDFDANTLTLEANIGAGTATYAIRRAKSLNEVFGTGDDAKLQGSFNSVNADIVWVPDGEGDYDRYYYNNTVNGQEFRSTADQFNSPPKPFVFFYPDGAFIEVKSTPKTVSLFGEVKKTGTIMTAPSGFSIFTVPSPAGQTLDELAIKDSLTKSFNSVAADILWTPDPNNPGNYNRYFVHNSDEWRSTADQFGDDQGGVVITGGAVIQRKDGSSTSTVVGVPAFFSTL